MPSTREVSRRMGPRKPRSRAQDGAPAGPSGPVKRYVIDPAAAGVLARSTISGNVLTLPPEELDRKLYVAVNKILDGLGGKWNRYLKGHEFPDGQSVGDALAAVLDSGVLERTLHGYFPTPRGLAEQLVKFADVRPEHVVLEPSAGQGAISDIIAAIVPSEQLYLVELLEVNHAVLRRKGYRAPQLICGDFLTTDALPQAVDRVVMNPPFEGRQDVQHVLRAYELLRPGGRLTAIMAAATRFRKDALTVGFRELVASCAEGSITENPDKAFKESGTAVRTVTVVMEKAS